ncbi:MAG: RNA methyltransferase [Solirubrobacteraceae bacterium]
MAVEMVSVGALDDPRLRDYVSLTDVNLRRILEPAEGLFMAESTQVIRRALEAGHRMRSVLLAPEWADDIPDILEAAARDGAPAFVADEGMLEKITGFHLHRGALAAMHRPPLAPVAEIVEGLTRIAVLEDLVDHTNVGAVFRSAAALGVEALLISPNCADPLYRRSVRVSMGTVFAVPWTRTGPWPATLPDLRDLGFTTVALGLTDDSVDLDVIADDPPERLAWILGTEGDGLTARTMATADHVARIPMQAGVDSLNVAAAGAVAFWATRKR